MGAPSRLAAKVAMAMVVCLAVRILLAQAPAPADLAAREQVDAHGYKYLAPNEKYLGAKGRTAEVKMRGNVRQVLSGQYSINDPAVKLQFREYYQTYLFPFMTTAEGLKSIAKDRRDFFGDLEKAKSLEAHRELLDLTLAAMKSIVQDNYRPETRYNAMLIISNLNDQEPNSLGVPQTLPEPMRTALPFILEQFKSPNAPDSIKLGALLGLSRHLEWENYKEQTSTPMQPALKGDVIKELTRLAEEKQPPPGRDPEAHNWMRRRAVEALSMACLKKSDADIVATMEKLLKDESEPLNVRFTVASVLGKIVLQPPAKIDPVATAKELGYMALLACDTELTRAENFRKNEFEREARLTGTYSPEFGYGSGEGAPGGMPGPGGLRGGAGVYGGSDSGGVRPLRPTAGGMPGDGYGEPGTAGYVDPSTLDPKHYRVEFLRRRLRQSLYAVQLGLTGGEDHAPPKTTPGGGAPTNPTLTTPTGPKPEPKGVFAIAKNETEKTDVNNVYYKVRKLIEAVEAPGPDVDFYQLVKDVRKEMKPLESLIGKRVPPPGAAAAGSAIIDDVPSIPAKPGPAKAPAAKGPAAPGPARPGKSASSPAPRSQPAVFGQPRTSR